jgi:hypothetical protein
LFVGLRLPHIWTRLTSSREDERTGSLKRRPRAP